MATRSELVEMIDNLSAALRNAACAPGEMPEADRAARSALAAEGAAMVEAMRNHSADNDPVDDAYIAAARAKWCDDDLEIDDAPMVSLGGDPGAWVAAWVWVTNEEAGIEDSEDDEGEEG